MQLELVALDGASKIVLEIEVARHQVAHLGIEGQHASASRRLRLVHGDVGIAHDFAGVADLFGTHGDADASGRGDLVRTDHDLLANAASNSLSDFECAVDAFYASHDRDELVAAEPRGQVLLTHGIGETPGDRAQQFIADVMAEGIVDGLEAVQVEKCDREQIRPLTLPPLELLTQHLEQMLAIGEPCQAVVRSLVNELRLEVLHPLDVGLRTGEALRFAVFADDDPAVREHPSVGTVGLPHAVLALEVGAAPFDVRAEAIHQLIEVIRVDEVEPSIGIAGLRHVVVAEQRAPARREVDLVLVEVPLPKAVHLAVSVENTLCAVVDRGLSCRLQQLGILLPLPLQFHDTLSGLVLVRNANHVGQSKGSRQPGAHRAPGDGVRPAEPPNRPASRKSAGKATHVGQGHQGSQQRPADQHWRHNKRARRRCAVEGSGDERNGGANNGDPLYSSSGRSLAANGKPKNYEDQRLGASQNAEPKGRPGGRQAQEYVAAPE